VKGGAEKRLIGGDVKGDHIVHLPKPGEHRVFGKKRHMSVGSYWRLPNRGEEGLKTIEGRNVSLCQQKKRLLQTDRARVRTACLRPIRSVRPKRPPLRPVRPERLERPGVLGLHLLRLVPPNTLVPVLTTRRTCHGLIPSQHPPSVSSRPRVSRVDLPDSGSPTA